MSHALVTDLPFAALRMRFRKLYFSKVDQNQVKNLFVNISSTTLSNDINELNEQKLLLLANFPNSFQ